VKGKRNSVSLALIITSLLLLLVLQGLWLTSSYNDAKAELKREINQLFKSTVFALHDSLLQQNVIFYRGDSAHGLKTFITATHDSLGPPPHGAARQFRDSALNFIDFRDNAVRVEVFSSSRTSIDSSDKVLKKIIGGSRMIKSRGKEQKTFIIKLDADSLNSDTLLLQFKNNLTRSGIELPIQIVKGFKNAKNIGSDFITDLTPINPMKAYRARVSDVNGFALKKISPQIVFAIFSTGLTVVSFLFLFRNLRDQQRLIGMKNDFIGNITHELKTPISTVSVALEALKGFDVLKDPKRTEEYLTMAQNELSRLTLLTDNVLKMTTLEGKGLKFLKSDLDLNELIERILASLKLLFEKQKAAVTFEKAGYDFTLHGSDIHLTNVVYNLIDNALKYSNQNAVINIHLSLDGNQLILKIKDNGIGIAKEYQAKIFDKFFRVPMGNIHNTHGYGLGLNYVAEVIRQHNGKIEVKSEPGLGSEFIVTLPKNS
jgi:signal transduction histidine kinase